MLSVSKGQGTPKQVGNRRGMSRNPAENNENDSHLGVDRLKKGRSPAQQLRVVRDTAHSPPCRNRENGTHTGKPQCAQHHNTTIEAVQSKRCLRRACSIVKDSSHPSHRLFALLPSGRRYRVLRSRTSRFRNSFIPADVTDR